MLVLVGRELCLFLHVDASAVPQKQRAGFVALEVRRAAPFMDPEHDAVWFGNHAAVWYWSHERLHGLWGAPTTRTRLRAEAVFRGAPVEGDGVEVLALEVVPADAEMHTAGFEARLWRQGHIVVSRWWPAAPTVAVWQSFLRGGGMDPVQSLPEPLGVGMREQPLGGGLQPRALVGQLRTQLPLLATVVGALLLALLAFQLAGVWRVASEIRRVEQRTAPLEKKLEAIIAARTRADEAVAGIEALLALRPPASQTRLLGEIQKITPPGAGWELMSWHQPGPETLEATLKGVNLDTAAIVSAWEQSPLLQEVSPATGSRTGELVLQARLTPLPEQTP